MGDVSDSHADGILWSAFLFGYNTVTDERDKAIERCAIFERAVDHYADETRWVRNHTVDMCDLTTEEHAIKCPDVEFISNGNGYDIAVKAKQDAAAPTGAGKEEE